MTHNYFAEQVHEQVHEQGPSDPRYWNGLAASAGKFVRADGVTPGGVTTVSEFRAVLDAIPRPLGSAELIELTSRLRLSREQWAAFFASHPDHFYIRNIYESPQFEVNIIGWRSGQQSSVHDHRGTACCVLVLDGILTNSDFCHDVEGRLVETGRSEFAPGEILSRSDQAIHRCGNEQPAGLDLATLHIYSPPLRPLAERRFA